jgi:hypothetical protein
MLHLYALAEHPAALAPVQGIDGSPLRLANISSAVDAVVSDVATQASQPSEDAILAHAEVIEQLAVVNEALLPARFGRGYAGRDALAEAIKDRDAQIREALERVRGCVEIGLRVFDEAGGTNGAEGSSGREYMLRRLDEVRATERLAAELHERLAAAARASTSRVLATPQLLLSAAYLLPRAKVEPFQVAVEEAEHEWPDFTFVCTGPWPPYSFAVIEATPS